MKTLEIEALATSSNYIRQEDEFKYMPQIPNRIAILAQSASGKTVLIINMLQKVYLKLYDDIIIISHSINIDPTWNSIKDKIPQDNLLAEYDEALLREKIETHLKIREMQKKNKKRRLGQMLVVLDDIIDSHEITHAKTDSILTTLFVRGRHSGVSVWFSSQKFKTAIPRIVRLNCSHYIIFRLSQKSERDSVLEEFSALTDMHTLLEIYDLATSDPYSFLYIDRTKHNANEIFHKKFDNVFHIKD
jgi:hypothetical protein